MNEPSRADKLGDVEMVKRLHATTDAQVWAREFNKVHKDLHGFAHDEGWLIGWFANAIEIGRDAGKSTVQSAVAPMIEPGGELVSELRKAEAHYTYSPKFAQMLGDAANCIENLARAYVAERDALLRVKTTHSAKLGRDAIIEACATVALEQRCERGTPWDLACVTIAEAIRKLNTRDRAP